MEFARKAYRATGGRRVSKPPKKLPKAKEKAKKGSPERHVGETHHGNGRNTGKNPCDEEVYRKKNQRRSISRSQSPANRENVRRNSSTEKSPSPRTPRRKMIVPGTKTSIPSPYATPKSRKKILSSPKSRNRRKLPSPSLEIFSPYTRKKSPLSSPRKQTPKSKKRVPSPRSSSPKVKHNKQNVSPVRTTSRASETTIETIGMDSFEGGYGDIPPLTDEKAWETPCEEWIELQERFMEYSNHRLLPRKSVRREEVLRSFSKFQMCRYESHQRLTPIEIEILLEDWYERRIGRRVRDGVYRGVHLNPKYVSREDGVCQEPPSETSSMFYSQEMDRTALPPSFTIRTSNSSIVSELTMKQMGKITRSKPKKKTKNNSRR